MNRLRFFYGLVLALALPTLARAAQVQYRPDVGVTGSDNITYLRDASGQLDVQGAVAASARFRTLSTRTVNFGFSSAAYWLHLSVHGLATAPSIVYLSVGQPMLDDVRLYVFEHGHLVQSERSGNDVPSAQHPVSAAQPILPVQLTPEAHYELYLRVASHTALLLPLQFQTPRDTERITRLDLVLNGAFTGLFIALLLYNLFLCAVLRQRAYYYYVLTVPCAFLALVTLDGFARWMLFPQGAWLTHQGLATLGSAGMVFNVLFTRALLQTRKIPWLDRLLFGVAALAACDALSAALLPRGLVPLSWHYLYLLGLMFLVPLLGAVTGVVTLLRGHPQARFYLLAQLTVWAAMLNFALTVGGVVHFTQLSRPGLMLAGSAQMLLFSLALADRIRGLQRAMRRAESTTRQVLAMRHQELERSVEERTRELDEARRHAEYLATTDSLTGVYNRRGVLPLVQLAIECAVREDAPLSLISFDLDHFKRVNDEFGHAEGDRVLCQLVDLTRQLVRGTDLFGRIGGEEFILVVATPREQAVQLAERLRAHLETHLSAGNAERPLTASFGVAALSRKLATLETLQLAADAALYRAKNRGRNRVEIHDAGSNETTRTRAILTSAATSVSRLLSGTDGR